MIRLRIDKIDPKKLDEARKLALKEADGFLLFDNRSTEYQQLFERKQTIHDPAADPCCDPPKEPAG